MCNVVLMENTHNDIKLYRVSDERQFQRGFRVIFGFAIYLSILPKPVATNKNYIGSTI